MVLEMGVQTASWGMGWRRTRALPDAAASVRANRRPPATAVAWL